jgi:hypothetical protein
MRRLLFLLILGTALWSGYWFAGSSVLRQGAEDWFATAPAQGLIAENSGLAVTGFPNRFDLTVEGLRLADPASGMGWQAPFAQVFAMTWKPWHIIAALPPDQVVTLPDQDLALQSDGLLASLRARPTTDLPLAMAVVETDTLRAESTLGWTVAAGRSVLSLAAVEGAVADYVLSVDIANLAPDPAQMAQLLPEGGLPPELAVIKLRATLTLSAPLDRHAGDANPMLQALDLTETLVSWGDLLLAAQGRIAPDDQGFAAGRIEISLSNWRRILPLLVASGAVKPELAPTVETMLAGLAQQSGDPDVLKLPLVLDGGWMSLGPVPLGPAPQMLPPSG